MPSPVLALLLAASLAPTVALAVAALAVHVCVFKLPTIPIATVVTAYVTVQFKMHTLGTERKVL
jgi:hypothetical protein